MMKTASFSTVTLAEIAEVKGGKRMPFGATLVATPTPHPYVRGRDIRNGRITFEEPVYVTPDGFRKIARYTIDEGDICITIVGNIGDVGITPSSLHKASLTENAVKLVNLRQDIDRRYLTYALLGPEAQSQMKLTAAGAAQPKLGIYKVNEIRVPLPGLTVQRRIADILSAYDDLIENCERRIRVLDEMARALYREWFVLFRYPGHEKIPLVDSPLGQIPKGWRVERVGGLACETRRGVPKGILEDGPTRYVGLEHIPRRSLALDAWDETSELGSNKLRFEPGEVLFGKIRPYFHKVSVAPFAGVCSADTFVISATAPHLRAFTTCVVSSDGFVAHASATANGAKMPRANWDVMADFPVALPPSVVLESFSEIVEPGLASQQSLVFRVHNLRKTRDLLLPRLLSGQISMEDAA